MMAMVTPLPVAVGGGAVGLTVAEGAADSGGAEVGAAVGEVVAVAGAWLGVAGAGVGVGGAELHASRSSVRAAASRARIADPLEFVVAAAESN
jgi:hypothetical protein